MIPEPISPQTVRLLQLAAQGLLHAPERPAQKTDVLDAVRRMRALQIDTISVVARSPYLVLFSRIGDYPESWLDELLAEGALFEYWAHAACFIPIEDYPLYRRMMLDNLRGWRDDGAWLEKRTALVEMILNRIRTEGPLGSADFERRDGKGSGWWDWKEEKIALERLFDDGVVSIARREKFQRRYDLTERVISHLDQIEIPPYTEMVRQLSAQAVCCLGAARARWVPDYFRLKKTDTAGALAGLVDEGRLHEVTVEGWDEAVLVHPDHLDLLRRAESGQLTASYTTLLSPFDPLVWDRERVKASFGFEFTLECYLPAAKRRYGYYLLPILHRGRLIGRLDAKAHRKEGRFEIKALYFEPGVSLSEEDGAALSAAIQRAANWHRTPQVTLERCDPPEYKSLLVSMQAVG